MKCIFCNKKMFINLLNDKHYICHNDNLHIYISYNNIFKYTFNLYKIVSAQYYLKSSYDSLWSDYFKKESFLYLKHDTIKIPFIDLTKPESISKINKLMALI